MSTFLVCIFLINDIIADLYWSGSRPITLDPCQGAETILLFVKVEVRVRVLLVTGFAFTSDLCYLLPARSDCCIVGINYRLGSGGALRNEFGDLVGIDVLGENGGG